MTAYTIVFLFVFIVNGKGERSDYWSNVGSVLFFRKDVHRCTMDKTRIAVLQARRYFQTLVPPPDFVDPDKDYVQKMLSYFRNAYTCIKRESPDAEVNKIMTIALSDVVGGYIKLYMLPFSKVYFYCGIVSFDDAARVLSFYTEVKKYLNTDGEGWRDPDQIVFNAIAINSPRWPRDKGDSKTKCLKDPCSNFAYLEKTNDGLELPMPIINWEDGTMFVPFKNESTFSLKSPKYLNRLNKYFDNAKCCVHSMGPKAEENFDEKFQDWLTGEVVPHLSDDYLYVPLANVLNLVNKTQAMCDTIVDIYQQADKKKDSNHLFYSKSVCIISTVLLLEIICCACAFKHIFLKKVNHKDESSMSQIENGQPSISRKQKSSSRNDTCCTSDCDEEVSGDTSKDLNRKYSFTRVRCHGIKLKQKPRSTASEFGSQWPSHELVAKETLGVGTRDFCPKSESMNNGSDESITVSVESKMCSVSCVPSQTDTYTINPPAASTKTEPIITCSKTSEICKCVPECLDPGQKPTTETYTLHKQNDTNIDETTSHTTENIKLKKDGLKFEVLPNVPMTTLEPDAGCFSNSTCPCTSCLEDQDRKGTPRRLSSCRVCRCNQFQIMSDNRTAEALTKTQALIVSADKEKETRKKMQKTKTLHLKKEIYLSRNTEHKRSCKPAYLEIQIEKPKQTEITLDITSIKGKIEKKEFIVSKIPKKSGRDREKINIKAASIELSSAKQTTETVTQEFKDVMTSGAVMNDIVHAGTKRSKTTNNSIPQKPKLSTNKQTECNQKMNTNVELPKEKSQRILKYKKRDRITKPFSEATNQPKVLKSIDPAINKVQKPENFEKTSTNFKKKSFLPKLKRPNAADDTAIKSKVEDAETSSRLNVTL